MPFQSCIAQTKAQLKSPLHNTMTSQQATTAEPGAVAAGPAAALLPGLPDEIVLWEILVRLPPKPLLRCRTVSHAWRPATSTRGFLLAHHDRQPTLPVVYGLEKASGCYRDLLAFDHRSAADAQLQPVARLDCDHFSSLEASCDGLVLLSVRTAAVRPCFSVCNPATREHGLLRQPRDASLFSLLGMYLHGPSGEYRLLLHRTSSRVSITGHLVPDPKTGCYVSTLSSDQPPRYIGGPDAASALGFDTPVLVGDCLHWSPVQQHPGKGSRLAVIVFDTAAESFRQIRVPVLPPNSFIFEMDGKLGIFRYDDAMKVVGIWVLADYEGEVWEYRYRIKLPVTQMIRGRFGRREGQWVVSVVTTDGVIILLLSRGQWLFHVNVDGQLVDSFHRDGEYLFATRVRLKQTLVPHTFFTVLEDYAVNAVPFI